MLYGFDTPSPTYVYTSMFAYICIPQEEPCENQEQNLISSQPIQFNPPTKYTLYGDICLSRQTVTECNCHHRYHCTACPQNEWAQEKGLIGSTE